MAVSRETTHEFSLLVKTAERFVRFPNRGTNASAPRGAKPRLFVRESGLGIKACGVWYHPTVHGKARDISASRGGGFPDFGGVFGNPAPRRADQSTAMTGDGRRRRASKEAPAIHVKPGMFSTVSSRRAVLTTPPCSVQPHQGGIHGDACGLGRPTTVARLPG